MYDGTTTLVPQGVRHSSPSADSPPVLTNPSTRSHHSVEFYLDDDQIAESVARFIGNAIVSGSAAIVVATPARTAAIEAALARSFDIERLRSSERYQALNAPPTLAKILSNGQPSPELFRHNIGEMIDRVLATSGDAEPRIAIYGELVALLSESGNHAGALALEQMWNEFIEGRSVSLHCGYHLGAFNRAGDEETVRQICFEHSHTIPVEEFPITGNENERRRATILLQQHAQRLAYEIAERQRAEREIEDRESALAAALATRDAFLLAAAHELKTPVTSLRVYAQLLQRDLERKHEVDPERLTSALQVIERQTSRLSYLIGQLVDVAQLESDTLHLDRADCELVGVVREIVATRYSTGTHRIEVTGDEHVEAFVDLGRIQQVVSILLANAVNFSPTGSRIEIHLALTENKESRFSVLDQGSGIAEAEREQIFQRFPQLPGNRSIDDLGLNLYLARQIVLLHGGTIHVEELEHPGSRFVVTLPAAR